MTPAGWNGRQPARRPRGALTARQVLWASVPVWSIGFLSFVPFLMYAISRPGRRNWAVFAGYLAATVVMCVALGAAGSNSAATAAVGGYIIALAGCAAVHAAVLFRPSRGVAPLGAASAGPGSLSTRQRNQAALAAAKDKLDRRKEARHLVATNPALARDLRIGRPDLPRDYDDGGLVDVNHVPVGVFSSGLGLTPIEARDVVAARDKLGRFVSAEELCEYTQLSPDRVDELRDLMIFP
jgi:DNA uptake protein ComE-like DNA-binding protein